MLLKSRTSGDLYTVLWGLFCSSLLLFNCNTAGWVGSSISSFHREEMRELVKEISDYGKSFRPDFIIIPQNGLELLSSSARPNGSPDEEYLEALDGVAQEHVFYGLDGYGLATDKAYSGYLSSFMGKAQRHGIQPFVIDYVSEPELVADAYLENYSRRFLSYAATGGDFDLDDIAKYPARPFGENSRDVNELQQVRNFLCILNAGSFSSKTEYLKSLGNSNYDMLVIDPFYLGSEQLEINDIARLKTKENGGNRLVIAYLNVGAAESFRYYWQQEWRIGRPSWLVAPYSDPTYDDEFWVEYWEDQWKQILFGNDNSYLKKIIDAGFDGVWLDNLEAYAFFENSGGI